MAAALSLLTAWTVLNALKLL